MPRRHFGDDGIGDGADEIRRNLDGVRLFQEGLNLADREPARIEGDNFVVEAGKAPLMFANQLRLEGPLAIARDLNPDRPVVGKDGLGAAAIAMIGGSSGFAAPGG